MELARPDRTRVRWRNKAVESSRAAFRIFGFVIAIINELELQPERGFNIPIALLFWRGRDGIEPVAALPCGLTFLD
jgi:hypothetical protein